MSMVENLDDGEFWLPSQFLSDDETFESSKAKNNFNNGVSSVEETLFSSEFGYGGLFGVPSYRSSPFSVSSETESDEEEQQQIAEFNRLSVRSNLESDFNNTKKSKGNLFNGSPQSTLCGFGSGCGMCCKGSSQGSPNSVCNNMSSARTTWDLLHAAAGEVERMRLNQQEASYHFHNRKPLVGALFNQQSLSHQQLQMAQFDMMRKQQMYKQHQQNQQNNGSSSLWGVYQQVQSNKNQMGVVPNRGGRNNNAPLDLSSTAWPSLQHAKQIQIQNQLKQIGSKSNGMRAIFLGDGRKESSGTGVFLPRPATESRKKPACSTALVPERVVQALNRKMEGMVGLQQQNLPRFNASSNMENAVSGPRHRSNYAFSQQKKNLRPQPAMNHEINLLPQEWTY